MEAYNLIIAGSRGWDDRVTMLEYLEKFSYMFIQQRQPIVVISGTAAGADRMGESLALSKHHEIIRMPADWANNGRAAGFIRNVQMAEIADGCIVCWDGESQGSLHMWNQSLKHGLDSMLVRRKEVKPLIEEIVIPSNSEATIHRAVSRKT